MNQSDPTALACAATTPERPAVYDASVLGAMFGSETAIITSVMQTFMTATRSGLDELAHAFATGDLAAVASVAHRITGASRMSGALALGHAVHGVEQTAKQGDVTAVQQALGALNVQWILLQAAIDADKNGR